MRQKFTLIIIGVLWLGLIINCDKKETRVEQSQNTGSNSAVVLQTQTSQIDRFFAIPANFKPNYKVLQVRDVSSDRASRFVVNISIPKDATKEIIENNLRCEAKSQYEKIKPDAMQIFAFPEGRSTDSSNSVGSLEFAPYGDWGRADEKPSLDNYKAVFKSRETSSQDVAEENDEMKKALAGDYQAQRNIAYYYSTGVDGHTQDVITGCAWRLVILKSKPSQIDSTDTNNKTVYCDQQLNSQQRRQSEIKSETILRMIKLEK